MPVISKSSYITPLFLRNGHFNTFYSTRMRRTVEVRYERERIFTPDSDFIDLDWSRVNGKNCVVLSHGLEGSSRSPYIQGMVNFFNSIGWDAVCWNLRGCSGEPNRTERMYHSGCSEDLECVMDWIRKQTPGYESFSLIGFSLGGNVVIKYLGEKGKNLLSQIKSAVCFSVPCDLRESAEKLACPSNRLYMRSFLKSIGSKLEEKIKHFPELFSFDLFNQVKTFFHFDELFTAPLHGYKNAADYYERCGAKRFLSRLTIPTLLVNAKDDPMMGSACYPIDEASNSKHLFLELPDHGGHAGFCCGSTHGPFWSELRAAEFVRGWV